MISDSIQGRYKIPLRTIGAISFTLLYFANPFDIIPDVIPFVGYIDDAFVVSLCIKFIGTDLEKYRKWKYSLLLRMHQVSPVAMRQGSNIFRIT